MKNLLINNTAKKKDIEPQSSKLRILFIYFFIFFNESHIAKGKMSNITLRFESKTEIFMEKAQPGD